MGGTEACQCIGEDELPTDLLQRFLCVERSCPRAFGIDSGHGHHGALVSDNVSRFSTVLHERLPDNPGVTHFLRLPQIFVDTQTSLRLCHKKRRQVWAVTVNNSSLAAKSIGFMYCQV